MGYVARVSCSSLIFSLPFISPHPPPFTCPISLHRAFPSSAPQSHFRSSAASADSRAPGPESSEAEGGAHDQGLKMGMGAASPGPDAMAPPPPPRSSAPAAIPLPVPAAGASGPVPGMPPPSPPRSTPSRSPPATPSRNTNLDRTSLRGVPSTPGGAPGSSLMMAFNAGLMGHAVSSHLGGGGGNHHHPHTSASGVAAAAALRAGSRTHSSVPIVLPSSPTGGGGTGGGADLSKSSYSSPSRAFFGEGGRAGGMGSTWGSGLEVSSMMSLESTSAAQDAGVEKDGRAVAAGGGGGGVGTIGPGDSISFRIHIVTFNMGEVTPSRYFAVQ